MDTSRIPKLVRVERFGYQLIKTATSIAAAIYVVCQLVIRWRTTFEVEAADLWIFPIGGGVGALWKFADAQIRRIEAHYKTGPWPVPRRPKRTPGQERAPT